MAKKTPAVKPDGSYDRNAVLKMAKAALARFNRTGDERAPQKKA